MSSFIQTPPTGLPTSPRANRQMLLPLDTTFRAQDSTPSSSSETLASQSEQTSPNTRLRNRNSLIFANATIPLSPVSSTSDESSSDTLLDGLTPRKRNGFVRFFCCFGREERARRRVLRETQFEKVGEKCHWTEY
ncbi:hypothetical protein E8E12_011738 [Didymella heteroderae]|uniref:Uncharacterized protein n=1 Tax=Didymella heteroderae TaxID=1769908 RepID=A0A9P4X2J4_9PLEO|nr:hypothetical protein E8E12_011738 [Didymella heteroderae]